MHILVLASVGGSFSAAAGQPFRSTTETTELSRSGQRRRKAYFVGANTHQVSTHAVVVDVSFTNDQLERAVRTSLSNALGKFPDHQPLTEWQQVQSFVQTLNEGSVVQVTLRNLNGSACTPDSLALLPTLRAQVTMHLNTLLGRS